MASSMHFGNVAKWQISRHSIIFFRSTGCTVHYEQNVMHFCTLLCNSILFLIFSSENKWDISTPRQCNKHLQQKKPKWSFNLINLFKSRFLFKVKKVVLSCLHLTSFTPWVKRISAFGLFFKIEDPRPARPHALETWNARWRANPLLMWLHLKSI